MITLLLFIINGKNWAVYKGDRFIALKRQITEDRRKSSRSPTSALDLGAYMRPLATPSGSAPVIKLYANARTHYYDTGPVLHTSSSTTETS